MSREIVVWGMGNAGKYLYGEMKGEILCIVDDNEDVRKKTEDVAPIVSSEEFISKYLESSKTLIITTQSAKSCFEILDVAKELPIRNMAILKPGVYKFQKKIELHDYSESSVIWCRVDGENIPVVPRLEINLVDGCNLNCKACTHFSSLFSHECNYTTEEYKVELDNLCKIGKYVRLRILGGEPLLVQNLDEYLHITREKFKNVEIEVVTNGLMIDKASDAVMRSFGETCTYLTISLYPPTRKKLKIITDRLNEFGVEFFIESDGEITSFSRSLTVDGSHDGLKSANTCLSSGCIFLRKGRIFKCPIDGLIDKFQAFYGLSCFPDSESVNIEEGGGEELYEHICALATLPVPLCSYCSEKLELIPWEVCAKPSMEDWFYFGLGFNNGRTNI